MGCEEKTGSYTTSKLEVNLSQCKAQRQASKEIKLPVFFLTVALDGSDCLAPLYTKEVDRDRAVDKETFCGLEILFHWVRDIPHKSRLVLGDIQSPV